jgi:palmitoyltransferase ZDHHC4
MGGVHRGVLALIFLLYFSLFGFLVYYCIFANPRTSPIARALTIAWPQRFQAMLAGIPYIGSSAVAAAEFLAQRVLLILYLVIVLGCWSIIFTYVYPWIDRQHPDATASCAVSTRHKSMGFLVFFLCMTSWTMTRRASPGIITPTTLSLYQHYPFDDWMYTHSNKYPLKLARSKFDRMKYQHFVPRYDHFCGWVDNTIGEENYRHFLLFLLVHTGMCFYGSYVLGRLFYNEIRIRNLLQVTFFDRASGREVPSSLSVALQYLFYKYLNESIVLVVLVVMSITLTLFLGYHIYITSYGLTSNETYKWSQIRKWYRAELQRYQQYQTKVPSTNGRTTTLPSKSTPNEEENDDDDIDVTCIPPTVAAAATEAHSSSDEYDDGIPQHPGPPPVNLYDRGFWQNWYQVLDPIPHRKRRRRRRMLQSPKDDRNQ